MDARRRQRKQGCFLAGNAPARRISFATFLSSLKEKLILYIKIILSLIEVDDGGKNSGFCESTFWQKGDFFIDMLKFFCKLIKKQGGKEAVDQLTDFGEND